ncbi:MAG: hypothetical protein ACYCZ0_00425 [Minisyncoccota bacterium]
MNIYKLLIPAIATGVFMTAGVASAQTVVQYGDVHVFVTPATTALTPGTGVTVATVQFTGLATGATVTSLPIAIGATGSGSVSNLANCRLVNTTGVALTGSINPVLGSNTFVFNSPLSVPVGSGSVALYMRCDIASNTPSGTIFLASAGTVPFAPGMQVNFNSAPSVPAGSTDVAIANIMLDASHSTVPVSVTAIPVSIGFGSGAQAGNLSNCRIRQAIVNGLYMSNPLIPSGGSQTFSLTSPLVLSSGTSATLSLACDVSASTPVGGTFSLAITPSAFSVTNASSGASITPTASIGFGPNGLPASTSGTVIVTSVDSAGEDTTGEPTTPGVPNTGLGGGASMTLGMLLLTALLALSGAMLLRRTQ